MESEPETVSYLLQLLRDEVQVHGVRYLIVAGVAVIGSLLFGRGYKKRIADLEYKIANLEHKTAEPKRTLAREQQFNVEARQQEPQSSGSKTWCPLTPKELVALTADRTTELSRDMVFEPYRDTWLKTQGPVLDVRRWHDGKIDICIGLPDDLEISLAMKEALYTAEDFMHLKKGDSFTAEGKFDSASDHGLIYLRECEHVPDNNQ